MALIALVLVGFTFLSKPSIPAVAPTEVVTEPTESYTAQQLPTTTQPTSLQEAIQDSATQSVMLPCTTTQPTEELFTLENDKVQLTFSTLGGRVTQAELKEFKAQEEAPLYLFTPEDSYFSLPLRTHKGIIETKNLIFTPIQKDNSALTLRLVVDSTAYLDFAYTLLPNDYRLRLEISGKELYKLFPNNMRKQDIVLGQKLRKQELSWTNENQYSSIYYKLLGGEVERLSEKGDKSKKESAKVSWVSFKDKFFATVWIADAHNSFEDAQLDQTQMQKDGPYTKDCGLVATFPFSNEEGAKAGFTLYVGPLEHHMLKAYDENISNDGERLHLEHLVYVGGSVFRWINVHLIIPIVDFLERYVSNWGIIILLLTLIIKTVLSPLTFKSYMSQAKMRVLRPQIQAINEKYAGNDQAMMMKRSQETMKLYRYAGANPMSGCFPMLLQMPFLVALYMYFPTAIALRGESFLWAKDLSTYDAIHSWGFDIPLIGDHLSLFCLLWVITNIAYSKYTMASTPGGDQAQMKMMKWMPYIMSIMFFFFFNNNASGLCYYYFISTLITILQFVASRLLINEEKVLAKIEENKKKPRKKSGFMARLEEAQRQQQQLQRNGSKSKR